MATHSTVLAWRIPGTREPGGLPPLGLHSQTQLRQLSSSSISFGAWAGHPGIQNLQLFPSQNSQSKATQPCLKQ